MNNKTYKKGDIVMIDGKKHEVVCFAGGLLSTVDLTTKKPKKAVFDIQKVKISTIYGNGLSFKNGGVSK